MSLILDALNRSRQDSEQMPGLSSDHFVDSPATGSRWMQWLLVCGLAFAVVVVGWLLFDRLPQPMPATDIPAEIVVESPPAPAAMPVPAQPALKAQPAANALPEQVGTPVAVVEAPARSGERRRLDIPVQAEAPASPVDPSVAALYQPEGQAVPAATQPRARPATAVPAGADEARASRRVEETIDIERLVETAQAELADARLSEHDVPLLSALSQQTKDAVPTLMYVRHDYSGNPAKSSVVINGKTLKAGGTVTGVKVLEILPDSVVLESRGTRFRLRALNSWVNL